MNMRPIFYLIGGAIVIGAGVIVYKYYADDKANKTTESVRLGSVEGTVLPVMDNLVNNTSDFILRSTPEPSIQERTGTSRDRTNIPPPGLGGHRAAV